MRAKQAIKHQVQQSSILHKEAIKRIEEHADLLNENPGALQVEEGDSSLRYSQKELIDLLPERNKHQLFSLKLPKGPYSAGITRNGTHLALGGQQGHLAVLNWRSKELICEINVKQKVRDVCFLHNETMFAAAQKKHVFIYDNSGMELHCLKQHLRPLKLQFLPYHFLLTTINKKGFLKYHDTSTGTLVAELKVKGLPTTMRQNPYNAVIGVGQSNGVVSMWTPNSSVPVVRQLAHNAPVSGLAFENSGKYMASVGLDGRFRIWDIRKFADKPLQDYFVAGVGSSVDISQRGLVSVGYGSQIAIWKDCFNQKQKQPYMKIKSEVGGVQNLKFVPYEDFLISGAATGIQSAVVPGAGEPNYDANEADPFESRTQRREREVHSLLEKIQPDAITLYPEKVGLVDGASKQVKDKEKAEEAEAEVAKKMQSKKMQKTLAKMKSTKKKQEIWSKLKLRERMREKALKEFEEKEKEEAVLETELNILSKLDEGLGKAGFEPFQEVTGVEVVKKVQEPVVRKKKRYVAT